MKHTTSDSAAALSSHWFFRVLFALGLFMFSHIVWAETHYQQAQVVKAVPIFQTVIIEEPHETCHQERVAYHPRSHNQSATPGLVGALVGGALGNAVGSKKSNKRVGAVVGSVLGYSIARDISRHNYQHKGDRVRYQNKKVCNVRYEEYEEERLVGYDVSYIYAGETYKTRTQRDPGENIRIKVSVHPA